MHDSQRWPSTRDLNRKWLHRNVQGQRLVSRDTRIISLGSCFAREIKYWLIKHGFRYLEGEKDKMPWASAEVFKGDKGKAPTDHASIAWERVYNTFTFEQILRYSFEEPMLDKRIHQITTRDGRSYYADLLRTRILYRDRETAVEDIRDHIRQSQEMFQSAEVLILTLGLTETWKSEDLGLVIPAHPGKHYDLPADFRFAATTFEENLDSLNRSYAILKANNRALKLIVTVSPVHLISSFRTDVDVISASCASKSILRAVSDAFCRKQDVYYFPSYEIATIFCPIKRMRVYPDNHHVSNRVVDTIMDVFRRTMIA